MQNCGYTSPDYFFLFVCFNCMLSLQVTMGIVPFFFFFSVGPIQTLKESFIVNTVHIFYFPVCLFPCSPYLTWYCFLHF